MKHNIQTTTPQTMTASEIQNLALHILALKGNYDFTGTNVTITPPTDMNKALADIIVKCAQKTGGTVNINGATEISDDAWEYIKQYGAPLWMIKAMGSFEIPFETLLAGLPDLPVFQQSNWKTKSPVSTLTDELYNSKWSYYSDWDETQMSWSGGKNMIASLFVRPTYVPTKFRCYVDDNIYIYINGTLVTSKTGCPNGTYDFDFSPYIKVGEVCHIVVRGNDTGGGYYCHFGFVE